MWCGVVAVIFPSSLLYSSLCWWCWPDCYCAEERMGSSSSTAQPRCPTSRDRAQALCDSDSDQHHIITSSSYHHHIITSSSYHHIIISSHHHHHIITSSQSQSHHQIIKSSVIQVIRELIYQDGDKSCGQC